MDKPRKKSVTASDNKPHAANQAPNSSSRIHLAWISEEERAKYRIPVYKYIL